MATNDSKTVLDTALEHVSGDRRDFLKQLFAGAAAAALPLITTEAAAQPPLPIGKGFFTKGVAPVVVPLAAKGGRAPRPSGKGGGFRGGKGGGGGKGPGR